MAVLVVAGCQSTPTPVQSTGTRACPVPSAGASARRLGRTRAPATAARRPCRRRRRPSGTTAARASSARPSRSRATIDDLTQGSLDLSLIRLPATDREEPHRLARRQPGRPGGSGVEFVRDGYKTFSTALRKQFDIVGFDPRGVNSSSAVRCIDNLDPQADLDPSPDNAAELNALVTEAHDIRGRLRAAEREPPALPLDGRRRGRSRPDPRLARRRQADLRRVLVRHADRVDVRGQVPGPDPRAGPRRRARPEPDASSSCGTGQAKAFEKRAVTLLRLVLRHDRSAPSTRAAIHAQAFDTLMAKIEKKPLRDPPLRRAPTGRSGPHVLGGPRLDVQRRDPGRRSRSRWPGPGAATADSSWPSRIRSAAASRTAAIRTRATRTSRTRASTSRSRRPRDVSSPRRTRSARSRRTSGPPPTTTSRACTGPSRRSGRRRRRPAPGRRRSWWSARPRDPATPVRLGQVACAAARVGACSSPARATATPAYAVSTCIDKAVDTYLLALTVPKDGLVCKTD